MAQTSIFKILYIADYTQAASAINMMQARIHKQEAMIRKMGGATGTATKQTGKLGGAMTKTGYAIGNINKKTGQMPSHFNRAEMSMGKMIMSAVKWAAVFTVVYTVIRSVVSGISSLIGSILELDQSLQDIASVTALTGNNLEKALGKFKFAILDYATTTSESIKDISRTIYLLETAGLDVNTALAAMPHTMNLVTATMGKAEETTKIMAGLYNTLADNIEGATTAKEKFQKMADVLAYTIAREQVLIGELQQGLQYIAPEAAAVSDTFTELVTVVGFLNTKMLKGSKAGRLMARELMQLIKNADKMKEILGVTYDPDKPLNFLDVMTKIKNSLGNWGKITTGQRDVLREIFAMRGGRPAMLQIAFFEEMTESIAKAKVASEGFSKAMKETRLEAVSSQWKRFGNIIKVTSQNFVDSKIASKGVAENLKLMNDFLEDNNRAAKIWVELIERGKEEAGKKQETTLNIATALLPKDLRIRAEAITKARELLGIFGSIGKMVLKNTRGLDAMSARIVDINSGESQRLQYLKAIGKVQEDNQKLLTDQAELFRDRWSYENKLVSKVLEHELSLRKKLGEEEEDIARARIDALEAMGLPLAEKVLAVTGARFKLEDAILNKILEQRDAVGDNIGVLEKLFKAREEMGIYEKATGAGRGTKELMEYAVGAKEYKDLGRAAKEEFPVYFPAEAKQRKMTTQLEREGIIPTAPSRPAAGAMPGVTRAAAIAKEIATIVVNQDIKNRINIGGVSIEVEPGMTAEQMGEIAKKTIMEAFRSVKPELREMLGNNVTLPE